MHESAMDERSGVVEVRAARDGHAEGERRGKVHGARREATELVHLRSDVGSPLHKVFGGIAADELLGEKDHGRAIKGGGARHGDGTIHVGTKSADRGGD